MEEQRRATHARYFATRLEADRNWLSDQYQGLVRTLARKALTPTDELDDLVQVGQLGLLQALDRYDPHRGVSFTTFAWATIDGELKRHHRDRTWMVRVPRQLQELYLRIGGAREELTAALRRTPTLEELAREVGEEVDAVIEALEAENVRRPASLDLRVGAERRAVPRPAAIDTGVEAADDRDLLRHLLSRLGPMERRAVELRFLGERTQVDIARDLGCSQMQVSRLLGSSLARLRTLAEAELRGVPRTTVGSGATVGG